MLRSVWIRTLGSPALSRARLAAVLVTTLLTALLVTACTSPPSSGPPRFPGVDVQDSVSGSVSATQGATLEVGGAQLEVPAGALGGPATLSLVQVSVPLASDEPEDGCRAGQVLLSDRGFLVVSDREVELLAPLTLRLPVEAALVPEGRSLAEASVSTVVGGYVFVQGAASPTADEAHVSVEIAPPRLLEGAPAGGFPMGSGIAFSVLAAGLTGVNTLALAGQLLQPAIATVDDLRAGQGQFEQLRTANFVVRYRGAVTAADASEIGAVLEDARAILVGSAGLSLPHVGRAVTPYSFYIDDFANHRLLGAGGPEGVTFPGSYLWGGASYLNASLDRARWASTAAHEYVHAVQWGPLTRVAPNSLGQFLDPESDWVFEGMAAALAGRLVTGGGARPARDPSLLDHPSQNVSAYSTSQLVFDLLQDFFFFLEKELGDIDFYAEVLAAIEADRESLSVEPSVAAVDEMLRARSGGADGLSAAWRDFVRDLFFDSPRDYHRAEDFDEPEEGRDPWRPIVEANVDARGGLSTTSATMPPLSYRWHRYAVPPLDASRPDQPTDLSVGLTARADSVIQLLALVRVDGGPPMELGVVRSGEPVELTIPGVRTSSAAVVELVLANPYLARADDVAVEIRVGLVSGGPPPSEFPRVYRGTMTTIRGMTQHLEGTTGECRGDSEVTLTLYEGGDAVFMGRFNADIREGEAAPECFEPPQAEQTRRGTFASGRVELDVFLQSTHENAVGSYDDTSLQMSWSLSWMGNAAGFPPREVSFTEQVSFDLRADP